MTDEDLAIEDHFDECDRKSTKTKIPVSCIV